MAQRRWWVRGAVLGSALLLAPVGAWADKLTELEQAFDAQQKSLQQLQQEMQRLRQERSTQQEEVTRRVMEVEKKAAEAAASSLQTGFDPWPGKGFYLKSADGQHRLNIGGYVQTLAQVEASRNEEEVNAADKTAAIGRHRPSTLKLQRVRVIFDGTIYRDFGFHIEPEFTAGDIGTRIETGFVSYAYAPWAKVTVGQMRHMYSLEETMATQDLDFAAQRSFVVRALAPDLQMGILLSGGSSLVNTPVTWAFGIFNGCGRVDQCPGSVDNDGDKEYTGRVTASPAMPFGALTVGFNADFRTFNMVRGKGATETNGVTVPVAGTKFHRFNPVSTLGDKFGGDGNGTSSNGFLINGDRVTTGADFVFDLYPFILKGEFHYADQERHGLGAGGSNLTDLRMMGGYGTIGYWIFGSKLKGLLANGRYEHLRVEDTSGNFTAAAGTNEHTLTVKAGTLGLTWYANPNVFVRANYLLTDVMPGRNFVGVSNVTQGELAHQGIAELMVRF
ncbi:MAG: hypothetical protein C3F08_00895 [Candidatus Methylomirabilota bacterium]|nr:MAG: hypothetical protein C3F08_00895 [candidate division NC10 bacterium]